MTIGSHVTCRERQAKDAFCGLAGLARLVLGSSGVVIVETADDAWVRLDADGRAASDANVANALTSLGAGDAEPRGGGWRATALPGLGSVALVFHNCSTRPTAEVLLKLAEQAAALLELRAARDARTSWNRRAAFLTRLAAKLRSADDVQRLASVAVAEIRRELGAEGVLLGLLSSVRTVAIEASDAIGGLGDPRTIPLSAFGPDLTAGGGAACFPTRSAAAVPILAEGRLAAVLHACAPSGRRWTEGELTLLEDAAKLLWSERTRTVREGELRAGEIRLRTVLESVSDGFYALDVNWRFTVFNRAAERFFGRSRESVIGRSLRDAFPEAGRSPLEGHFAKVMASGVPGLLEMRSAARPDREMEIRASAQPGGGVAVTFTDVTCRNQQMRALVDREARLAALVGQSQAGIAETTLDGRFIAVNARFCEIVGRTEPELLDLDQASITYPDDIDTSLRMCREMIDTGCSFGLEKRYVLPNGMSVRAANAVGLMRSKGRTTALAVMVGLDELAGGA